MNEFEKLYTVEDIAQMTMLTTRTIRNYLKDGQLTGRKIGGQWRFTGKDIDKLFENSNIEAEISSSRRQEVMDFIDGINTDIDGDIQICTIVDYYCSDIALSKALSDRFSDVISAQTFSTKYKYYYEYIDKEQKARYTFFGSPTYIKDSVSIIEVEWEKLNHSLGKFTDRAKNYADYRPSYPKDAINLIFSVLGKKGVTVADIGSGTGKMTELLLNRNCIVYAVEPNADMRKEAENKLKTTEKNKNSAPPVSKNFRSINGTAENTTLKANSVDLITCAEAYHWFDNEKTLSEFHRILKPSGYVFLLWNSSGENPYSAELGELFDKYCKQNFMDTIFVSKEDRAKHLFGEGNYTKAEFDNNITQPYEGLLGGILSASYSPKPEDDNYNDFVNGIKDIFDKYSKDDMIKAKFKTVCFYGQL
ncbi:MAG TPA: methyltransferase domain-containing protein [Mobilitalea sp.]|nr:methyltransferase domain-containing protein [Mobilitalea sp.]